jgi:hypothetical protein
VLANDPETARLVSLLPEIPEPLPGNEVSLEMWNLVGDQVRVGFKGVYAMDVTAVLEVMGLFNLEDPVFELQKMKRLFEETYLKKE